MRILYTLLFSFVALAAQAQFKDIKATDSSAKDVSQLQINTPIFKKIGKTVANEDYEPISLDFVKTYTPVTANIFHKGSIRSSLRGNSAEQIAEHVFSELKMRYEVPELITLEHTDDNIDDLGIRHITVDQYYNGIKVYAGALKLHLYKDEKYAINGKLLRGNLEISTAPDVNAEAVLDIAVQDMGGVTEILDSHGIFSELEQEKELNLIDINGRYHLAYIATVYKNIAERWIYVIDAHDGKILDKHLAICKLHNHHHTGACTVHKHDMPDDHATVHNESLVDGPIISNAKDLFGTTRQINTYEINNTFFMIDAARTMYDNGNSSLPNEPAGAIWTIDAFNTSPQRTNFNYDHVTSSNSNFANRAEAVSAHFNGGIAYEYFKNVHNRESINGSRGNIISLVNVTDENGNSMGNAFWNGVGIFYGNGDNAFRSLARALDVAGHELSHGVIQNTANLQYQGESGALNESFADIFGVLIERENWTVGEQVVRTSVFPSGALRSLADPHNGASTGDFARGWQPSKYSERYRGSEDNGGVHINSGIPNHAFYLFANKDNVGVDKAEKVYYRALTKYLTASSQFVDARNAVIQSAKDLYDDGVATAAGEAFDAVEIFGGSGGDYQNDVDINPGSDLILFTTESGNNIYIADSEGNLLFNPLTELDPISVPSITDDGSEIIFVASDKTLRYLFINWETNEVQPSTLSSEQVWRNAVFSKDGLRMAAVTSTLEPKLFVYDFEKNEANTFDLVNPTFSNGVFTENVKYADALEFDFTGEYVMYDAINTIKNNAGNDIEYWDISFIKVYDNDSKNFAAPKQVSKLFTNIEEGISIGNPTFSKNSPYIIAFDLLQNGNFDIAAANTETQKVGRIFEDLGEIGYPHYSRNDDIVIFNAKSNNQAVIAGRNTDAEKINGSGNAFRLLGFTDTGIKWGRWFSNGERDLSDVESVLKASLSMYPNPVENVLHIELPLEETVQYSVTTMDGRLIKSGSFRSETDVKVQGLSPGAYILTIKSKTEQLSRVFLKG